MNALWGQVDGAFIVVMMGVFIGIWVWAWRTRHKEAFARMARLPAEDRIADGTHAPGGEA